MKNKHMSDFSHFIFSIALIMMLLMRSLIFPMFVEINYFYDTSYFFVISVIMS